MPIRKVGGGFKWGSHGHTYPTREGAERQAAAAYAHGYKGDMQPPMQTAPNSSVPVSGRRKAEDAADPWRRLSGAFCNVEEDSGAGLRRYLGQAPAAGGSSRSTPSTAKIQTALSRPPRTPKK